MEFLVTIITAAITAASAIVVCILNNKYQLKKMQTEFENNISTRRENELNTVKDGIKCLLRSTIVDYGEKYEALGWCPTHVKTNLVDVYNAYHALGGNDIATSIKDKIVNLPDHPPTQEHLDE